ncbi:MAG: DUF3124 domain-containing protein [Pseudomonadota bacterium]
MKTNYWLSVFILFFAVSLSSSSPLHAQGIPQLSRGQTIYVPVYSHIYSGDQEKLFLLTATLSIRNIDPKYPITITVVDYYETQGNLLKKYLTTPLTLKPLESLRYVIPEKDKTGGSGANFIVEWKSENFVNPPITESVMIGTQSQQGVSFTSRGQPIITAE